jgi:hypothetical protein
VVGCIEVSDYLDLIVEAGQEEAVYAAFLAWLAGRPDDSVWHDPSTPLRSAQDAPVWDVVDLCNQPVASLAYTRLAEMARGLGWTVEVFKEDVCPVVTLPHREGLPKSSEVDPVQLWEIYLESLDKKERHEIRRKLRRLEREVPDARLRLVTGGPELATAVDDFIALHRLSSRAKDAFMTDEMQDFFRAIAAALAGRGWLQLSFLEIIGRPAASYFCFDYNNQIFVYNSGYDPEVSPQLSSGWVLLAWLIQEAIAQGRERFDFLQWDEDYKHRFGGVDEPVHRTLIRRA